MKKLLFSIALVVGLGLTVSAQSNEPVAVDAKKANPVTVVQDNNQSATKAGSSCCASKKAESEKAAKSCCSSSSAEKGDKKGCASVSVGMSAAKPE